MAGRGAPCGACRVLRRKCTENCLFSPYFSRDKTGADEFDTINKIFGQNHFTKMLQRLPVDRRHDAVASILYQAQAWIQDPFHGCSSKILALQQENEKLRQQLAASHAQVAELRSLGEASRNIHISEYGNVQQSQIPALISSGNDIIFSHDPQYSFPSFPDDPKYSFASDMQSIMSQNVAGNNYPGEASAANESPTSLAMYMEREYMRSDMGSISKVQQMDLEMGAFQFHEDTSKLSQDNISINPNREVVQAELSFP